MLPAVVSLVLVALALLVRLLSAAADQRRSEVALASMRGLSSRQMWAFGLAEPLTRDGARDATRGRARLRSRRRARSTLADRRRPGVARDGQHRGRGGRVRLAVVATVFSVGRALSEPLSSQLAGVRRPTNSSRWAFVAKEPCWSRPRSSSPEPHDQGALRPAVVRCRAAAAAGRRGRSDHDAATVVIARQWARRTSSRRGITGFVATRAVSRRREASLVILPLTAALAISVFAAGVYAAASTWRTSAAATQVGADDVVRVADERCRRPSR